MNNHVLYLIRHASAQYAVDELGRRLVFGLTAELTDEGKVQCVRLARRILQREMGPLDMLVTIPYVRAEQTATILAPELGINTIVKDDRLRGTQSAWESTLADEFMTIFGERKRFDDPRTLETLDALGERMRAAYNEILLRFEEKKHWHR